MRLSGDPDDSLRWVATAGRVLLAAVLAVLLLPSGLAAVADGGLADGWQAVLVVLLVVLHLTLVPPLVTRWPVVAFAVGSAAMLGLLLAPDLRGSLAEESGGPVAPLLLPSGLVWFVLLYVVSSRSSAPWPTVSLATGLVGSLLALVRLWDSTAAASLSGVWPWRLVLPSSLVVATVAAWALGRYRATRREWTAALAERAAAAERDRIAREMHDVVAHSLAVVVAQAEGGRMLLATQPERGPEILGEVADHGRAALAEMRGLLGVLRRDGDVDGPEPPQPSLADLPALVASVRSAGRSVGLSTYGDARDLPATHQLLAYRLVQESLTNVVRHAPPGAGAEVVLDWTDPGTLEVSVTDDGPQVPQGSQGRTPHGAAAGRGLKGMRERVEAVGGTLVAGPTGDTGWRTCARIPA